jgi:uncharacterized protein YbaA (DUF1428 family)
MGFIRYAWTEYKRKSRVKEIKKMISDPLVQEALQVAVMEAIRIVVQRDSTLKINDESDGTW